jgi:hypothetical protein
MNTIAPPPLPEINLDGDVKAPQSEALIDVKDVMTDPWAERDCLCGTFSAGERPIARPVSAFKSRW